MKRDFALFGVALLCLARAAPAYACWAPILVISPDAPDGPAQEGAIVKATVEQALVFEEDGTPLRVVSYRLRVLEGSATFEAGQIVELIAPDADVDRCVELLDPATADPAGVVSGYVQLASKDERGGFYLSRMDSRRNAYLRRTYPRRGEWKPVRFSAKAGA